MATLAILVMIEVDEKEVSPHIPRVDFSVGDLIELSLGESYPIKMLTPVEDWPKAPWYVQSPCLMEGDIENLRELGID